MNSQWSSGKLPGYKPGIILVIALSLLSCSGEKPVDFVDPFICTKGDHGHWLPAALVPFGLVELCPDTWPGSLTADGDFAHSGYDFSDEHIRGFSHLHRGSSGGTSVTDRAGLISIMPLNGIPSDSFLLNPVTRIDKRSERASAGYYSVHIPESGILAELTATSHCGYHRYTWNETGEKKIMIYEGNRRGSSGLICRKTDGNTIEGYFGNKYFVITADIPFTTSVFNGSRCEPGSGLSGQDNGSIICSFNAAPGNVVNIVTGISLVSVENARENLEAEAERRSFDNVRREASEAWNRILSLIEVKGTDEEYKKIFYTALYHTCFLPVNQTDADGTYPGLDRQVHRADGYIHYDGYAFWDSFRTKYPLYSLWIPGIFSDITSSLLDLYRQADNWGRLPASNHPPHGADFKAAGRDGYQIFASCRHEHMLMVAADAYFKGLMKVDIDSVYPFMKREVLLQMPPEYDTIGFIPARPDQTGEYCWDNRVLAEVAKATGREEDYSWLMKRSEYWRNTWDPAIRFFRARSADGRWLDFPEDPAMNREKYTYEGSKWHWRWNVIHDVPSLIEVFGGQDEFVRQLEYFFENDLYTAGNQIDLHAPFLFNIAGSPWLTQKWVRRILTEPMVQRYGTHGFFPEPVFDRIYKAEPDGFLREMDDDYGCMSAWYCMSAMGLYQMCTGIPLYQVTAPVFDEVRIKLDNSFYSGKKFTIKAEGLDKSNIYIRSATLNGKPFSRTTLTHDEITAGGELVLVMGPEPCREWGR